VIQRSTYNLYTIVVYTPTIYIYIYIHTYSDIYYGVSEEYPSGRLCAACAEGSCGGGYGPGGGVVWSFGGF